MEVVPRHLLEPQKRLPLRATECLQPEREYNLLTGEQIVAPSGSSDAVSRPFPSWSQSKLTEIYLCHACSCHETLPSWNRSILTEIYLCHACSCHEILRTATAGQDAAERRIREQLSSKGWASAYEHSYDPHWAAKNHSVDQIVFRGAPPEISLRFHAVCPRSWTSHRPRSVPTEVYLRFQAATSRRAPAASTTSAARLRRRTLCVVLSGSVLFCSSQRARAVLLAPLAQRRVLTARWSTHRGVSIVCSVVASD
jgi:hypothetical protein